MSEKPIRVLVVDASPQEAGAMPRRASEVEGIEVVGVSHTGRGPCPGRRTAAGCVAGRPDAARSPQHRSRAAGGRQPAPGIRILAVTPDDPPHDRIMLAAEAGALGFISRYAASSDCSAAIERVHRGEPWLPLHQTYEVLQDGAGELAVSSDRASQSPDGSAPGPDSPDRVGGRHHGLSVAPLLGQASACVSRTWGSTRPPG